jgi:hypothetical protein
MARFTEDVIVMNQLSGRVHVWVMCEPLTYRLRDPDTSESVTVAPRFPTDFASVPRPLWGWIPPWDRHGRAAIVHDFLYQRGSIADPVTGKLRCPERAEADRIFREAMAVLDDDILSRSRWKKLPAPLFRIRTGLAAVKRWLMWAAVAVFGRWAYKRQSELRGAPAVERQMFREVAALMGAMAGVEPPPVPDGGCEAQC